MSHRPTTQTINLLDYPSDAPLVHVDRSNLCLGPVKQKACNVNLPMGDDIESWSGIKDYAKSTMRKLKGMAGDSWTKMKRALKDNDKAAVKKLLEGGFNVLQRHPSKGKDITTLEYVENLEKEQEVKPDIIRLLKLSAE